MISLRDFWRRNRRRFLISAGVVGSGYVLYKLYDAQKKKLADLEREREKIEFVKAHMKVNFENIQKIAGSATLRHAMRNLSSCLEDVLDLSQLTERLMKGKGPPNTLTNLEKLALWDQLKVLSFTRMVLSLWAMTVLSLYVQVLVNILGRHLYLDTALGSVHEDADLIDMEDQKKFLDSADFLPNQGMPTLVSNINAAAMEVLKEKQLRDAFSKTTLGDTIVQILDTFMNTGSPHHWVECLMPHDGRSYNMISGSITGDAILPDATKFDQLMREAQLVLSRYQRGSSMDILWYLEAKRRRKTKHQEFLGNKREEIEVCPSYWKMVGPLDRSCSEEDGEELLQREENPPCVDSPVPRNSLFSSATVQQSNSKSHCQCQWSPAKRRSPFSEKQSLPSSSEEEPTAKRQLLLDEQDHAAVFARHGGYSKIVLPYPDQHPVPGSESPSGWRSSSPSGLAPPQDFSPSGSTLPLVPLLGRTISDASSVITNVMEGSLNACKEFPTSAPTLLPLRPTPTSSNLEGNPNSCKQQGFFFSTSPQPTAMLPPRPRLHRTVSDPTPVAMTTSEETPNSRRAKRMMHRVKEMSKWFEHIVHQAEAEEHEGHCRPQENIISQPTAAMLPPRPTLHRTVSDPTPTVMSTEEETPNARRVKSMLHKVKEMGKWFERIVHEAESEEQAEPDRPGESVVSQDVVEPDEKDEEAVSVEKVGECLSVQFKCPCGKGYKILLSGKECYYKLL